MAKNLIKINVKSVTKQSNLTQGKTSEQVKDKEQQ